MGSRGYNAGGFAYMRTVTCPRCGARRKLGCVAIRQNRTQCANKIACDKRLNSGKFLHRIKQ
jgi:hypothetical protein